MAEGLHIRLFGGFDIRLDGRRPVGFRSMRLQRFLALLALRDGAQPRARIAFELWPDSTECQARTNLRKLLHEFRAAIPGSEAFIETGPGEVRWRDGMRSRVDVLRFRDAVAAGDLEAAAQSYAGDLLPACYDDWIIAARRSLRADALRALGDLMKTAAARGEPEALLARARRVLALEPTDEVAVCHQIRCQLDMGDRNAAMRAYRRYADAMERDLGLAPGDAVRALHRRIQSENAVARSSARNRRPRAADTRDPRVPLAGRDRELSALRSAWTRARSGAAHLVLLTGEPGIGKTRLAEELAGAIRNDGHAVATARAYEAAGRLPWGPVVDILRSDALADRIDALETAWRAELSRLLPELSGGSELPARGRAGDPERRHRLFDAVRRAIVAPDRPCLLVIDDLQWCDTETIEMIGFVIRSDPGAPVLIVGTARAEEVSRDHPLTRLVDALERDGAVTTVALDPLDAAAAGQLAARIRPGQRTDPEFVRRLWTETAGNPLFLLESLRAGASPDGPTTVLTPTMRAVMRARLGQLSGGARRVAEMAAVIGRAISLDLIAVAADTERPSLIDAIDELLRRRIIAEHGPRYDFSHDKLREVALETISPARRRFLHRAAADALSALHGGDSAAISPQLAAHYDQAGMIEPAIEAYRTAGAGAVSVSAFEAAVAHYGRSLALLAELPASRRRDRLELDLRIALGSPLVAVEGYGAERAHQLYERAMTLCRKLGAPADPAILRGLGLARLQGCRFSACDEMGNALTDTGRHDPVALTEGHYLLGVGAFWQGRLDRSRDLLESAIASYDPDRSDEHLARFAQDPRPVCMVRLALTELWQGDPARSDARARAAQDCAADIGHLMTLGYVITYAAIGAAEAEDTVRLEQLLADGEALRQRFSMRYLSIVLEALRSWLDLRRGAQRGLDGLAAAVQRSRAGRANLHLTYMILLVARAHRHRHELAPAREAVAEGLALTARHGQNYLAAEFSRLEGELALAGGDRDRGRAALRRARRIAGGQKARWQELKARTALVRHFPGARASAGLRTLMDRLPSGHDRPAFRAAARALERAL